MSEAPGARRLLRKKMQRTEQRPGRKSVGLQIAEQLNFGRLHIAVASIAEHKIFWYRWRRKPRVGGLPGIDAAQNVDPVHGNLHTFGPVPHEEEHIARLSMRFHMFKNARDRFPLLRRDGIKPRKLANKQRFSCAALEQILSACAATSKLLAALRSIRFEAIATKEQQRMLGRCRFKGIVTGVVVARQTREQSVDRPWIDALNADDVGLRLLDDRPELREG